MKVLVIVPCYNEEECIERVIHEINHINLEYKLNIDILVVNDCSTDNSILILKKLDCLILDLPVNLGIGGAMQAGYKYAFRNDYDIAIQMDGDGQHPPDALLKLISPILANEADVVIGSRFLVKEGFQSSNMRRLGIKYFRWLNNFLINQKINDSTSGFRAFNKKTIAIVNKYYPDEYPEPEAIVQFGLSNIRMREIPVKMRERQGGVSSINSSKAIYYMIKVTLGILFVYIKLNKTKTTF